jgi:hypothetical protein
MLSVLQKNSPAASLHVRALGVFFGLEVMPSSMSGCSVLASSLCGCGGVGCGGVAGGGGEGGEN